ncbi:MAG: ACT domain-containing protein [Rhodothermales bacterium]|nr:ACT domain-containing protein [Rhodothermales bacterium]
MPSSLTIHPGRYAVCRLAPSAPVPAWARGAFVAVTRTPAELSIVCPEAPVPDGIRAERGWRLMAVDGPLDFALTGILAAITRPLAQASIPVFALSTFDTDYLLVREADLGAAVEVLRAAGHTMTG